MAVFLLAIVGTGVLMVIWEASWRRWPRQQWSRRIRVGVAVGGGDELRIGIRRETEY